MNTPGQSSHRNYTRGRAVLFWVFIAISIPLAIAIVAYAAGYRFDKQTGSIVETSAIAIHTVPRQAQVLLNNELQSSTTPFIETLAPGEYTITVQKDGYRTWEKQMTISPGESLLFPEITLLAQSLPESVSNNEVANTQNETIRELSATEKEYYESQQWKSVDTLRAIDGPTDLLIDEITDTTYFLTDLTAFDSGEALSLTVTDAEWLEHQLLYTNGLELWVYDSKNKTSYLLLRQTALIHSVTWHPDANIIIYSDTNGIHALELDERDMRQRWTLVEGTESASNLSVLDRGKTLVYAIGDDYFELTLRQ